MYPSSQVIVLSVYFSHAVIVFGTWAVIFLDAFKHRPSARLYHYILSNVALVSSLCYLCLAANTMTPWEEDFFHVKSSRAWHSVLPRYIDWCVSTPLQLVVMGTMGRLSVGNIFELVSLQLIMIIAGALGHIYDSVFRWIFFSIGAIAFYPVYVFLFEDFDHEVVARFSGRETANQFFFWGRYLLMTWLIYPILWILLVTDVANFVVLTVIFSFMDLCAKGGLVYWLFTCCYRSLHLSENEEEKIADDGTT